MRKIKIVVLHKKVLFAIAITLIIIIFGAIFICKCSSNSWENVFVDPNSGIIVIDPGHGGIDGGTSWDRMLEKDINLDVSLKIKKYLEKEGYTVVMTRDSDISLENLSDVGGSRHARDLNARMHIINNGNAQLFLSIHVNSHLNNLEADGSIIFYNNNYLQNKTLAHSIQSSLNSMTVDGEKRTIHDPQIGNYFLLKHSKIPGVIVEIAFISNTAERNLLMHDKFKDEIAQSIIRGIKRYFYEQNSAVKGDN